MIRLAILQDVQQLMDLLVRLKRKMKEDGIEQWPDNYPAMADLTKDIENQSMWVFTRRDKPLAMITLDPEVPKQYDSIPWRIDTEPVNSIHRLAVDADYQGQGLARKLVEFVEQTAMQSGYKTMRLDTYSRNIPAFQFYSNMGYKPAGTIRLSYMPKRYYCLEKKLNAKP
jgi:GNAT superfamily N-acetyltransferase